MVRLGGGDGAGRAGPGIEARDPGWGPGLRPGADPHACGRRGNSSSAFGPAGTTLVFDGMESTRCSRRSSPRGSSRRRWWPASRSRPSIRAAPGWPSSSPRTAARRRASGRSRSSRAGSSSTSSGPASTPAASCAATARRPASSSPASPSWSSRRRCWPAPSTRGRARCARSTRSTSRRRSSWAGAGSRSQAGQLRRAARSSGRGGGARGRGALTSVPIIHPERIPGGLTARPRLTRSAGNFAPRSNCSGNDVHALPRPHRCVRVPLGGATRSRGRSRALRASWCVPGAIESP